MTGEPRRETTRALFERLLREQIARMRPWTWEQLREVVDTTSVQLHEVDGRTLMVETDVFWDDDEEEDLRVAIDVRFQDGQSEARDSFIKAPDGSFVGE